MEDSPSYKKAREQFDAYGRVKSQLETMYGNTYYVANMQVFTRQNEHETVCSWSEFQPTVFPQTDTVALTFPVTDINSVYNISQKELIKLLGSFLKTKHSPIKHYVVEELPDGELKIVFFLFLIVKLILMVGIPFIMQR